MTITGSGTQKYAGPFHPDSNDVDTSSMSDDVDEGYLSEGEVFVPKKRAKKDVSNQDGSQVVVVTDGNEQLSLTLNENVEVRAPEPPPSNKNSTKKKQTKKNNVCHLWLQRKCHRGKNCKYLHEKKKPGNKPRPKTEEDDAVEENGKPKSLYAAVCPPPSHSRLTGYSYCKVKWKGRTSSCYKYYCISTKTAY